MRRVTILTMPVTGIRSIHDNRDIELVCFDLGGVLIRICRTWQQAVERAGVELRPPGRPVGDSPSDRLPDNEDWNRAHHDYETGRSDDLTFFTRAGEMAGITVEQTKQVLAAWLYEPYPGVEGLIQRLTTADHPVATACLSNTNAYHWLMMTTDCPARLPLEQLTYRFTSFEVGARKPDPAIYEHVERTTGAAPHRILFFDDHPPNVAAARQRGWNAHQIDHSGNTVEQVVNQLPLGVYGS